MEFNTSTAEFAVEMLFTGLNIVPSAWVGSPAATELESVVVDWMAMLMGLPDCFLFSNGDGDVLECCREAPAKPCYALSRQRAIAC